MIGVGPFELWIGLLIAALFVYLVFRNRVSTVVLILLVVVLTWVTAFFIVVLESYFLYALSVTPT
jgi:hypothetical protein